MAEVLPEFWRVFSSRDEMNQILAESIASDIQSVVKTCGEMLFGASGGSTPIPVYQRLAQMSLPWSALKVVIVDERWVPITHPDSNQKLVMETLLMPLHSESICIGLWSDAPTLETAAELAEQRILALSRPLDTVLLGMGEDGHFASLFSSAETFSEAIDPHAVLSVVPITPMPPTAHPQHARISLTLSFILRARRIILALTGNKKREVLLAAMREQDPHKLPVAALFQPGFPAVEIYWSE